MKKRIDEGLIRSFEQKISGVLRDYDQTHTTTLAEIHFFHAELEDLQEEKK